MKNSELLTTQRQDLDPIEKQHRYILRCLVQKNACPNCGHMLNFFEGAGIDIDDWKDRAARTPCRCRPANANSYMASPSWSWEEMAAGIGIWCRSIFKSERQAGTGLNRAKARERFSGSPVPLS